MSDFVRSTTCGFFLPRLRQVESDLFELTKANDNDVAGE